jgi:xanthine dehydrogenase YagR molybdenum-binding subunit
LPADRRLISPSRAFRDLVPSIFTRDDRSARYVNDDPAEYLIPVCADIRDVEVIFVPEEDHQVSTLGIKGLGELGNVGTDAAVADAVYHAAGQRIRDLPIRIGDFL